MFQKEITIEPDLNSLITLELRNGRYVYNLKSLGTTSGVSGG